MGSLSCHTICSVRHRILKSQQRDAMRGPPITMCNQYEQCRARLQLFALYMSPKPSTCWSKFRDWQFKCVATVRLCCSQATPLETALKKFNNNLARCAYRNSRFHRVILWVIFCVPRLRGLSCALCRAPGLTAFFGG